MKPCKGCTSPLRCRWMPIVGSVGYIGLLILTQYLVKWTTHQ